MEHQCQETEPLLRDYAAGLLTQADRQRVELITGDCAACAAKLESIEAEPRSKAASVPPSSEGASVGQVLTLVGILIFYGTCIKLLLGDMLSNPETPLGLKIGLPVILLGLGLLLARAVGQRWQAAKTDKYKNVKN
ncbi:MAG: hypothetical protein CMO74_02560 [Verrucomicrobiales bacterium]|nr:hypothetical protein [Verrucomicrobiales bacterium]|tara:strand:+ start:713 stop:1120 length:408 start_codon:yes stop_codon:yes gene_type:complete